MSGKTPAIQIARRTTLGILLIGMTVLAVLHQKMSGIPSIDALDPFGGLETLMKLIAGGEFIKKIEPGTVVLFGGTVALGILLSRFFCGWFCAFGALQGIFGWMGKKIFRRRFTVPAKLDRILRYLKYPLLALIIGLTWWTGSLVIRPYDPLAAYGHLSAGMLAVWTEFAVGFVVLVLVLVGSLFYERVFCKYLCPLGAFNALLGRIPLFRIKRDPSTCVSCSKCDRTCPMNVEVASAGTVTSPECISCLECVTVCPTKKDTLKTTFAGKAWKPWLAVLLGFALFALAAAIGQSANMLRFVPPSLQAMAAQGRVDVSDIKGSDTYRTVADSFGVDLERLYRELGLDPKKVPEGTRLKDTGAAAGIAGFEADQVRAAVAKILGVPYSGEAGGDAPKTTAAAVAASPDAAAAPFAVPDGFALEGTMTIAEIAKTLGASEARVIGKLGLPPDIPVDQPLREMKDRYGYTMPELKAKFGR